MRNTWVPEGIRRIVERIREDVQAALENDPAARSAWEVVLCYPGVHALWLHRVAHFFWERRRYLLARLVSHLNRALTGGGIHPGARLGRRGGGHPERPRFRKHPHRQQEGGHVRDRASPISGKRPSDLS